jgi:hypothetical protein
MHFTLCIDQFGIWRFNQPLWKIFKGKKSASVLNRCRLLPYHYSLNNVGTFYIVLDITSHVEVIKLCSVCTGHMQILCHFTWGTRASVDSGICEGPGTNCPHLPRDRHKVRLEGKRPKWQ